MDRLEKLINNIDLSASTVAEIGALCNPLLTKAEADIRYIDYASASELRAHYAGNPAVDPAKIVETDAIWGSQTLLSALGQKVDYVLASHVVEHVPDLITWLSEIDASLTLGGEVRLAVPDRRFTFDFLRRETTLCDVLAAYVVRARVPQPFALLDYYLNATEVDTGAAWQGLVTDKTLTRPNNFDAAMTMAKAASETGAYHDAHCWVFTPRSFAELMGQLGSLRLLPFACDAFFDTELNSIEFFVWLRKSDDVQEIIASWQRMAEGVRTDVPGSAANLRDQISALSAALGVSRHAEGEARAQVDFTSSELIQTKAKLELATREVKQIRSSRSWKLTAPYRELGAAWYRLRRR